MVRSFLLTAFVLFVFACKNDNTGNDPKTKPAVSPVDSFSPGVAMNFIRMNISSDNAAKSILALPDDTAKVNALFRLCIKQYLKDSLAAYAYARYMMALSSRFEFPEGKAKAYCVLGRLAGNQNSHEKAIGLFGKADSLFKTAGSREGIMYCYYWTARSYRRIADYLNYEKYLSLLESEASMQHDSTYLSYAYEGYGNLYRYLGEYQKSIDNYLRAIQLSEALGNLGDESTALNNMSLVYGYQDKSAEELKVLLRNYAVLQRLGEKKEMVLCLSNLSATYDDMGDKARARQYIDEAMNIVSGVGEANIGFKDVAAVYGQYALMALADSNYKVAFDYFNHDLNLRETNRDIKGVSDCYMNLAMGYSQMGDKVHSEEYLLKALLIAQDIGYRNGQMNINSKLADLKQQQGDYKTAFNYLKEYDRLKDSLAVISNEEQVADVEARFKVNEQQQQIQLLSRDKVMQEMDLGRKRILLYSLGIGLALVFLLVLVAFRAYRQKQRANLLLEEKVEERTSALVRKNKDLKDFIYKSSHDLRSPVASVKGLVNIARLKTTDADQLVYLSKMSDVIQKQDQMLETLLKISVLIEQKIEPQRVNVKGLIEEITEMLKTTDAARNVTISFAAAEDLRITTDRDMLTSIIQNLAGNAIKYSRHQAEPSFVRIEVSGKNNGILFRVSDNGEGITEEWKGKIFDMFSRASPGKSGFGLGLYIVRNAVEMLRGTITVESQVKKGSVFSVWLPDFASYR